MADKLSLPFSVKKLSDREFEGLGSTFGNVDLGGDIVIPGAFRKSIEEHRRAGTFPLMFWMHQPDKVPGAWREMSETDEGLYMRGELANTQLGNEARELLQMSAIRGLSIGYRVEEDAWDNDGRRLLKQIDLREVSIVSMPMNPRAQVAAAKLCDVVNNIRDWEQVLRLGFGLSGRGARKAASATWAHIEIARNPDADVDVVNRLTEFTDTISTEAAIARVRAAASRIRSL